jgi:membrane-associated phospholipid phosphatase
METENVLKSDKEQASNDSSAGSLFSLAFFCLMNRKSTKRFDGEKEWRVERMKLIRSIDFTAAEKITLLYIFVTSGILVFLKLNSNPVTHLFIYRLIIAASIVGLAYLNTFFTWRIVRILRFAQIGGLLSYWYPETFEFNRFLPNCDHLLAELEQMIFGFQPAFVFSGSFPQGWVSELMNMGYLSYYPMILLVSVYFVLRDRDNFDKYFFTLMFSFFVYYCCFILFPASGPQFYFPVIGADYVSAGVFPQIGAYFNDHTVMVNHDQLSGFFQQVLVKLQQTGERPTAAFPSAHVGVAALLMILLVHARHYILAGIAAPFFVILVMSTVYIRAHYLIDSIAGLISAFILFALSFSVYKIFGFSGFRKKNGGIK